MARMGGPAVHLTRAEVRQVFADTERAITGLQRDADAHRDQINERIRTAYAEYVERWHEVIAKGWREDGAGFAARKTTPDFEDWSGPKLQQFLQNLRKWHRGYVGKTGENPSVGMTALMVRIADAAVLTTDPVELNIPHYREGLEDLKRTWDAATSPTGMVIGLVMVGAVVGALAYRGATKW